jgi:hypothetical protein
VEAGNWTNYTPPDSTEQTFVRECTAGSAFQVTFKFARCYFLLKRSVEDQFPGHEFPGVGAVGAIMLGEAMPQITGEPRVSLSGIRDASEEIDVAHYGPPSLDTGELYNVTLICARDRFEQQPP